MRSCRDVHMHMFRRGGLFLGRHKESLVCWAVGSQQKSWQVQEIRALDDFDVQALMARSEISWQLQWISWSFGHVARFRKTWTMSVLMLSLDMLAACEAHEQTGLRNVNRSMCRFCGRCSTWWSSRPKYVLSYVLSCT